MTDLAHLIGILALAGIVSLALLACTVYAYLAVLEAAGIIEAGTTDLVVEHAIKLDPHKNDARMVESG